jgi:hypothetical protein
MSPFQALPIISHEAKHYHEAQHTFITRLCWRGGEGEGPYTRSFFKSRRDHMLTYWHFAFQSARDPKKLRVKDGICQEWQLCITQEWQFEIFFYNLLFYFIFIIIIIILKLFQFFRGWDTCYSFVVFLSMQQGSFYLSFISSGPFSYENYAMEKVVNNALNVIFVTRFDYFHLAVMLNK